MNKKGFTLIELLVSLVLLSIVMVFMTSFVVNLRDKETDISQSLDIGLLVNQAVISRQINNDILSNGGISNVSCTDNYLCTITFGLGETRYLSINGDFLKYYDDNKTYLARTLSGDNEFESITYTKTTVGILKISIVGKSNYNIEAYSYK